MKSVRAGMFFTAVLACGILGSLPAVLQDVLEWKGSDGSPAKEGVECVLDCTNGSFVLRGFNLKGASPGGSP